MGTSCDESATKELEDALVAARLVMRAHTKQKMASRAEQEQSRQLRQNHIEAHKQAHVWSRHETDAIRAAGLANIRKAEEETLQVRMARTMDEESSRVFERQRERSHELTATRVKIERWTLLDDLQQQHKGEFKAFRREQRRQFDDEFKTQQRERLEEERQQQLRQQQERAELVEDNLRKKQLLLEQKSERFRQHVASGKDAALGMKHGAAERRRSSEAAEQQRLQSQSTYLSSYHRKKQIDETAAKEREAERRAELDRRKQQLIDARAQEEHEKREMLSSARKRALAEAKLRAAREKEAAAARRAMSEKRRAEREQMLTAKDRAAAIAIEVSTEHDLKLNRIGV